MPRRKTPNAAKAPPPPSIEILSHSLRTEKRPRASLLVEARRTLAARVKAGVKDDPATITLREVFELRLADALSARGPKSASLLNVGRLYEQDKAALTPTAEWTREDTLAAVERALPEGFTVPFPAS